jgi:hypothetical protein
MPQRAADVICNSVDALKESDLFKEGNNTEGDKQGRSASGYFTRRYNRRKDVLTNRFASISDKRQTKTGIR